MDWLPIVRIALALIILSMASYSDWRTRMASDMYWVAMGGAGLALLASYIITAGIDPLYLLFLIPIGWFFLDMLWDREDVQGPLRFLPMVMYVASLATTAFIVYLFWGQSFFWELVSIPVMFVIYYLLYIVDIIKGGANAKALMALSLLVPMYPVIGPFPLVALPSELSQYVMPFSLLTLFYGALLTLAIPLVFLVRNLRSGDRRFPTMLFGVKMDLADAKKKFVWPMEYVEDGELRISNMPRGPESLDEHYAMLEAQGLVRIWVTPKIPMIIPLTAGVAVAAIVGNLMFILF
ncbi:MAG TPA: A24 family peptidase C-terminal domain-containing protein [Methanomassiliicoccales archaeon]|nr:A24 family peptidase C-terminal domain-containing protein [Methanomassiliicoccales archaeon]